MDATSKTTRKCRVARAQAVGVAEITMDSERKEAPGVAGDKVGQEPCHTDATPGGSHCSKSTTDEKNLRSLRLW